MSGYGAVSGRVTDASGATVPQATVTVANQRLGIRRTILSNDSGLFNVPSLTPSAGYEVEVAKSGFATHRLQGIEIAVGQIVNVSTALKLADVAETVEVTADQVGIDITKTGVSDVVGSNQILNLPINGRRVDSFVLLSPAVANEGNFGLLTFRGIPGGNAFLTDGNDTTNQLWNENAGRTRIASNISQDAVQEFQVLSNNYSAEFGRAIGGVVNTLTRSGSNELHGTAFWFYRDQNLNARDRYAPLNPEEKRNQLGGSVGGPIVKDRIFFFANSEITRRNFPLVSGMTTAPLFNSNGDFVGTCTASASQCDVAVQFVSRFNRVIERRADNTLGFAKLDFRLNDRNSLSTSFNVLNWESPTGIQTGATLLNGAGIGNNGASTVRTRFGRAAWTSIATPTVVNELRFGYFKDRLHDYPVSEFVPATGLITLSVQGVGNLGQPNFLPRVFPTEDRYQIANVLSWTADKHLLKFGFDWSHVRDVQDQVFNGNGTYVYPNFTAFAQDFSQNPAGLKRWQSFAQGFGPPLVDTSIRDYVFFVQDQYRATRSLTLNLGLRYDYAQFDQPTNSNPDYPQTARIPQANRNFAPRFGFSFAPGDAKTVIRGGYGLFWARVPGGIVNWLHRDNSNFQYSLNLQGNNAADQAIGPVFPAPLPATDRRPPAGSTSITFASDDFRTPYTQQADVGIERQIFRDTTITASYIWSRGIAFTTIRDANVGALGEPVTFQIRDAADAIVGAYTTPTYRRANRVDRNYQRIGVLESRGNTWYNAFAFQARSRRIQGNDLSLSYTWSHALDENLGATGDNLFFGSTPRTLFNEDFRNEKATSTNDQRHRLVINSVQEVKFGLNGNYFNRVIVDNWLLSGIYTYATLPYNTPTVFVSGAPFADSAFNNTLNGLGGSNRVPFQPRSSLFVDNINRVDARVTKVLPFSERMQVQLSFEAFNVTNSQYDTNVLSQAFQVSGGIIRPTPRLGEGNQSAGFPDGTNARRAQFSARFVF
ncbi:MAG: TonB-dependent receptor [Bryobacterales bacterium]|nr:TonB-dependent receptor [Bryobacterales bacterium]